MSFNLSLRRRSVEAATRAVHTERGARRTSSHSDSSTMGWPPSGTEVEIGALGLLIYQAAKEGSTYNLRFALSCRGAKDHINYQDSATKMTPLMVAATNGHLQCVKILISRSADMNFSIPGSRPRHSRLTALSLATRNNHTPVIEYLQACIDDVAKGYPTRAHLEEDVVKIAENPNCTEEEVQEFDSKLQWLLDNCSYALNAENEEPSLLIRAAIADNHLIVYKLVEKFNAPKYSYHPETAKNCLHFACTNISSLRYYFAEKHKELLCIPDERGNSPLHIVCSKNDVEFASWLFSGILGGAEDGEAGTRRRGSRHSLPRITTPSGLFQNLRMRADSHAPVPIPHATPSVQSPVVRSSSHVHFSGAALLEEEVMRSNSEVAIIDDDDDENDISNLGGNEEPGSNGLQGNSTVTVTFTIPEDSEVPVTPSLPSSPLPISFIQDIRLFRKNTDAESVLHVLASGGHTQLLEIVLGVAEKIKHVMGDDELGVITDRDGFTRRTPIEEGLMMGNLDCVHLLLKFAEKVKSSDNIKLMDKLFENQDLFKVAVLFDQGKLENNVHALKLLVSYGLKAGLEKSITLADLREHTEVIRLLLFYQTQVINSVEFATVHPNHMVSLKTGYIKWEGFNLRQIDGKWFHDANCAIESVSRIFHDPDQKVHKQWRHTQAFFKKLGASCLGYFANADIPSSLERSYTVPLVDINLTENHLTSLPSELFQQRHLRTLRLSHNDLQLLPTSLYDCPKLRIVELDWNSLQTIPEEFCRGVGHSLEELNLIHNSLTDLPTGLWLMPRLKKLKLNSNSLTKLHRLSQPDFYADPDLSQNVMMLFEATSDGELTLTKGEGREVIGDPVVVQRIQYYLHHLMSFLKTALVLLKKDDPSINLAKEVIRIHLQNYYQTLNPQYQADQNINIVDRLCDRDEEEGGGSLIELGFTSLEQLHLDQNCFREQLPWDLPCLVPNLKKLFITENELTDVDLVRGSPAEIHTLCLSKNQIVNTSKNRSVGLPCGSPLFLLCTQPERGNYCTHCQQSTLNKLAKLTLDNNLLKRMDLVNISSESQEERPSHDYQAFASIDIQPLFPSLTFLNLAGNLFPAFPQCLEKLRHLSYLNLSENTDIREIPSEVGQLNPQIFLTLLLNKVFIKNIPHSIMATGITRDIICYLKSIREKSQTYRSIKLMVVGEDNKGKTSLLLNLTKSGNMERFKEVALNHNHQPLATNGVELGSWEYAPRGKEKVTFMTWDFGGQEEYYATHQCFLTNRSLFLLVWNAGDGEAGLQRLRFWLENIEVRARDSPVIVVATHADSLPQAHYKAHVNSLQSRLKELYSSGPDSFAFPRICSVMHVVNSRDSRHMEQLRNYIYNTAVQYCPPSPTNLSVIRPADTEPLLEQKVPENFVKLQDVVRRLAHSYSQQNRENRKTRAPILTRHQYLSKVRELGEIHATDDELDQATNFLHSNGILIHYTDSELSDLYFVDPQWLCSTLADIITIRERNPHVKDGIISSPNLEQILSKTTSRVKEIILIMRKFEVMFKLDENRYLIPSFLPLTEATPYVIMPQSTPHTASLGLTDLRAAPPAPISSMPEIIVRYFVLPFTPNGFFPRLTARVVNSELAPHIQASLSLGPLSSAYLLNQVHWECWRTGISLVWNHMEILRIAPLGWPLPHSRNAAIISSLPLPEMREELKGMEIIVAAIPEDQMQSCPIHPPHGEGESCNRSRCMASWIIHRVTDLVETVMEDWYEVFGFRRNLNNLLSCMTSPCPQCFKYCHELPKHNENAEAQKNSSEASPETVRWSGVSQTLHMFTLPFCSLKSEGKIRCPDHGLLNVANVAPDLVFADFAPVALIPNQDLKVQQRLGEGGFAKVYQGLLTRGNAELVKVAVKEHVPSKHATDFLTPELEAENASWAVYHEMSVEARMMYHLHHDNILTLLGITLHPIRLVLELAKEDLSSTVARYHKKNKRFSRRTLKATLIQIADAMAYLHSKNILFRDLKPGNVLVWDFPLPQEQWNPDAIVLVKLADYGISKQISPQGIHSKIGTPQFLPPEVLLHSEHEAASLKVDVYSFGMVMYFLFSFTNPFGSSMLVGSQLRQNKRPELHTKSWPNSVQLVELMTWCWSNKPNHRPTFDQILSTLREETIHSLVGGMPLSHEEEAHAACIRTVSIPRKSTSTLGQNCSRLTSVIPSRVCGIGMESGIEVWYGTVKGSLNVIRYSSTGSSVQAVEHHQSTCYISCIVSIKGNVWVATMKGGLWVYSGTDRQPVAMWGETEREEIFNLVVVDSFVLALTNSGMFIFDADLPDPPQAITILSSLVSIISTEFPVTSGVYIPKMADISTPELWVCCQRGQWLQVLSPKNLSMKMEVELPPSTDRKIKNLMTAVVKDKCCIFFSDRHMLYKYRVKDRQHVDQELNCFDILWSNHNNPTEDHTNMRNSRITSLVAGDDGVLYVATARGKILLVKAETLEVKSSLLGYNGPARCLQMLPMSVTFSRMVSSFESTYSMRSCTSTNTMTSKPSTSSIDSLTSPPPVSPSPSSPIPSDERSVLLTFGVGYRGVVGRETNRPDNYILPHGLTQCSCCTHFLLPPRSAPSCAYLLFWSRESNAQRFNETTTDTNNHLDSLSE